MISEDLYKNCQVQSRLNYRIAFENCIRELHSRSNYRTAISSRRPAATTAIFVPSLGLTPRRPKPRICAPPPPPDKILDLGCPARHRVHNDELGGQARHPYGWTTWSQSCQGKQQTCLTLWFMCILDCEPRSRTTLSPTNADFGFMVMNWVHYGSLLVWSSLQFNPFVEICPFVVKTPPPETAAKRHP